MADKPPLAPNEAVGKRCPAANNTQRIGFEPGGAWRKAVSSGESGPLAPAEVTVTHRF